MVVKTNNLFISNSSDSMRRFIVKACLFVLPFLISFGLNKWFFNPNEGDLVRLGYLYSNPCPKSLINNQFESTKRYVRLSEIDLSIPRKFDVIVIGDSFSDQDNLGYPNYIANENHSVLLIDRVLSGDNPIQTLIQLLNVNFFDTITADYLVLQSVEGRFNNRIQALDFDEQLDMHALKDLLDHQAETTSFYDLKFFSDATIKAPLNNIQFPFSSKPFFSKTYKCRATKNDLFSNAPQDILFYEKDINYLESKNDSVSILKSIKVIEGICDLVAEQKMKLIMLISPDKYDLYFPYIAEKEGLITPRFFEIYDNVEKKFINVDAFEILRENILTERDVYFYDDTHWTPKGAKIIASEIANIISNQESSLQ